MLVIALAIKLDSPGPILFQQVRVGRDKKPFVIVKFRTMRQRAEAHLADKVLSTAEDPRITRVGRLLRRTSLDEIPQLFNVVRGQMSLVGPRPLIPEQLQALDADSEDRFTVLPGLTGLAQVSGRRSLPWPKQIALDVAYARHMSFRGDLLIIFRSVRILATGAGVYGSSEDNWRRYVGRR
jgi:lipopolysaccharide/colanic/teichoic acid biosynthesis glycosyltransferase